jgi:hypothetical protein
MVVFYSQHISEVLMSKLIVATPDGMDCTVREKIVRKINQMFCDSLPSGLLFVQVKEVAAPQDVRSENDVAYRTTPCGVGGVALIDEREFILFFLSGSSDIVLRYISKSV